MTTTTVAASKMGADGMNQLSQTQFILAVNKAEIVQRTQQNYNRLAPLSAFIAFTTRSKSGAEHMPSFIPDRPGGSETASPSQLEALRGSPVGWGFVAFTTIVRYFFRRD